MYGPHFGVFKTSGRRCIVIMPVLPDTDTKTTQTLVCDLDQLPDQWRDIIVDLVSGEGVNHRDLGAFLNARNLRFTGQSALESLHIGGYLQRVESSNVILTPNRSTVVPLDDVISAMQDMDSAKPQTVPSETTSPTVTEVSFQDLAAKFYTSLHNELMSPDSAVNVTDVIATIKDINKQAQKIKKDIGEQP